MRKTGIRYRKTFRETENEKVREEVDEIGRESGAGDKTVGESE